MSKTDKAQKPLDKSTLKVEQIHIDKLKPNERNPRINDNAVDAVARSIEAYGFNNPIITDGDLKIAAGHTRLKAAIKLGLKEVPVIRIPGLIGSKFTGFSIADNKTAELADWDDALLGEIVFELKQEDDFDLSTLGFDDVELRGILADYMDDDDKADEVPPVPEVAKSKLGDLYQLGDHRLLCGDATKKEDVERLMSGDKADMIFTDPPYGVNYIGGSKKREPLVGDTKGFEIYYRTIGEHLDFVKDCASVYVCFAGMNSVEVFSALRESGLNLKNIIIWAKNNAQFGMLGANYHQKHEPILFGCKGKKYKWYGPNNEVTVWEISRASKNEYHPTQKPVELVARAIRNSSFITAAVLDIFLGSGTTMIACEQLGRRCFGMEIEPRYVQVCIERWEQFTGQNAILLSTGQRFSDIKSSERRT
jgi:DNA modification methylase